MMMMMMRMMMMMMMRVMMRVMMMTLVGLVKTSIGQRCFCYKGAQLWNNLNSLNPKLISFHYILIFFSYFYYYFIHFYMKLNVKFLKGCRGATTPKKNFVCKSSKLLLLLAYVLCLWYS